MASVIKASSLGTRLYATHGEQMDALNYAQLQLWCGWLQPIPDWTTVAEFYVEGIMLSSMT